MTNDEYREIRRRYREAAQLDPRMAVELRQIASRLVRYGGLPTAYAPYGVRNEEAEEEVFQSWYAGRLVKDGQLQALLDRGATVESFRRLGERSLRQHVLNQRERSQVQNLYARTARLLREDNDFTEFIPAARPQDTWWGLSVWTQPRQWSGRDDDLYAAAWSIGGFAIIRYKAEAKKLGAVLAPDELKRCVAVLLGAVHLDSLDDQPLEVAAVESDPAELEQTALAIIGEMTQRQAEVLLGTAADETQEAMAARLQCSVGTINNEQRRVAGLVDRHAADAEKRGVLLRKVVDLLHEEGERR